ncbi:hypothetical protein [Desulfosarcina cetonica]|uniref:hypothetical protein n=1 Tax=Desulfosarcina cetonica TaxID=90730 RepID=UPI001C438A17|nr:hypothetical protein [Desulfosarcina cetonica]
MLKSCRVCQHAVDGQAVACPGCGAPYPAREKWDGYGFEYKSGLRILGLPLLHISFKYRPNRVPVVARGIITIGQFGIGVINISQFGIGVLSWGSLPWRALPWPSSPPPMPASPSSACLLTADSGSLPSNWPTCCPASNKPAPSRDIAYKNEGCTPTHLWIPLPIVVSSRFVVLK